MNIKFEYLYRDAGNFKNWGEVVFSNPRDLDAEPIIAMAGRALIDRAYFVANRVGVPDLHFPEYNGEVDHDWHEAHSFQPTGEAPTDDDHRSIDEFLESLRSAVAA
jgi:hypothetical protein